MADFVLVGGPAVGKTTVGQLLAQRLAMPFHDADQVIEQRCGKSISQIFADDGEAHFRALEYQTNVALLETAGVLALGGGAVLDERLRAALTNPDHVVVWLQCAAEVGSQRVGSSAHRPLLVGDVPGRLRELHQQRAPLYAQVADLVVDTDGLGPSEVVDQILAQVDR